MAAIAHMSQARATALTRVEGSLVPAGWGKFSTHRCSPNRETPWPIMRVVGYTSQARATAPVGGQILGSQVFSSHGDTVAHCAGNRLHEPARATAPAKLGGPALTFRGWERP